MRYGLAIFDFDGTLADTLPWFAGVLDRVADEFGLRRVDEAERDELRAHGPREIARRLGVASWQLPRIVARVRELKAGAAAGEVPLFAGVGELLAELARGGVTIAIVSSDAEANVRRGLGPANAALIGQYECGASLFGKHRRLGRVLRRSGLPAARAIFIGDEVRDAEAAQRAGIAFGAAPWGFSDREALLAQAPAEIFASIEEIGRRLAAGGARAS